MRNFGITVRQYQKKCPSRGFKVRFGFEEEELRENRKKVNAASAATLETNAITVLCNESGSNMNCLHAHFKCNVLHGHSLACLKVCFEFCHHHSNGGITSMRDHGICHVFPLCVHYTELLRTVNTQSIRLNDSSRIPLERHLIRGRLCGRRDGRRRVRLCGSGSGRLGSILGNLSIELHVGIVERLLRCRIESRKAHLDCLVLDTKHGICLADVDEATSRDDLVDAALREEVAIHLRPCGQHVGEVCILQTELLHRLDENLLLRATGSVFLLVGVVEAVKKRFIHHASTDETTIVGTLALGVRSCDNREAIGRSHPTIDLLEVHALAFKDGLKAHDLLCAEIDFVEQENRTCEHGIHHWPILPDGISFDEAKTTKQVVFVGLRNDVHAKAFALHLGTNLLDHRGLAVARKTSDKDGSEKASRDDLLDVRVVTPCNILWRHIRNERRTVATSHAENGGRLEVHCAGDHGSRCDLCLCDRHNRRNNNSLHWRCGGLKFRHMELTTTRMARLVLDDPGRRELLTE